MPDTTSAKITCTNLRNLERQTVWSDQYLQIRYDNRTGFAFRMLKKQLEDAVGKEEAKHRIVAITDAKRGALRTLADQEGYKTFIIPDNVAAVSLY